MPDFHTHAPAPLLAALGDWFWLIVVAFAVLGNLGKKKQDDELDLDDVGAAGPVEGSTPPPPPPPELVELLRQHMPQLPPQPPGLTPPPAPALTPPPVPALDRGAYGMLAYQTAVPTLRASSAVRAQSPAGQGTSALVASSGSGGIQARAESSPRKVGVTRVQVAGTGGLTGLLHHPEGLRQAFVASVVLGAPKSLEN